MHICSTHNCITVYSDVNHVLLNSLNKYCFITFALCLLHFLEIGKLLTQEVGRMVVGQGSSIHMLMQDFPTIMTHLIMTDYLS